MFFADLVSLRSISIAFHNLGNIADGKLSRFLFKTRSNLYEVEVITFIKKRRNTYFNNFKIFLIKDNFLFA